MSVVSSIFKFLQFNKKNWKAVVLCLLAATVFWFFNSLNKTYTTILSFPVEFQYDQDNFVSVTNLPKEVKMNVTGMGWALLRRSAGVKVPSLLFPLEHPSEVKKIMGSTLPALFANQVSDLQINFVITDTLWVDIEPNDGRWLSLSTGDFRNNLREEYGVSSDINLVPDSIFVQGPRRVVEELVEPYPVPVTKQSIDEDFDVIIEVPFANDRLVVDPPQVQVMFKVEKFVQHKDSAKISVINIPLGVRQAIGIKYIHYTLSMPNSFFENKYQPDSIKAILNLKDVKKRKSKVAPLLIGIPRLSHIIQIDSVQVSF
jgi:hypothetical protein